MLRRVTKRFFFIVLGLAVAVPSTVLLGACTPDTVTSDAADLADGADLTDGADLADLAVDSTHADQGDISGDDSSPGGGIVINEIAATNSLIEDPDFGDTSDWIELYNESDSEIQLAGYELSDRTDEPGEGWIFPGTISMPARSYLVVWADNRERIASDIHANFALDASGEVVCLTTRAGQQTCVTFEEQLENTSMARFTGDDGAFQTTYMTTPGSENLLYPEPLEVALSPPGGRFESPISVELSATQAEAVYYTLDGNPPTDSSARYSGPIELSGSSPLRAVAIYPNGVRSPVVTESYFVGFPSQLPILDLVLSPDALFDEAVGIMEHPLERGSEWERVVTINWLRGDEPTVSFPGGLRVHGGFSRQLPKNALRIYLRDEYGLETAELDYFRVFGTNRFNELVISSLANDSFLVGDLAQATYIRDALVRDTVLAAGEASSDGFFISLHLNGEYWGLYEVVERINEEWLEQRFDAPFGGSRIMLL